INLGATANHDGADQIGGKDSSVFLDATQKADVNQLLDMGIKLYVQQTPTYQSVDIDAKL
ncbi:MAG: PTS mannose/fructose/sorbose transporter subunit IIAB, partial [Collinsella sp.]|nr:PTS mannose/fructose/sorbose transporter subunit IIAB [Collinsella sp.]